MIGLGVNFDFLKNKNKMQDHFQDQILSDWHKTSLNKLHLKERNLVNTQLPSVGWDVL